MDSTQDRAASPAAPTSGAIAGLVDYQPGAVVSREIISRPTGTVTVFAFAAGQGLSEHTAPFDALVQVVDGQAEVTISQPSCRRRGEFMSSAHKPPPSRPPAFKMMRDHDRS